MTADTVAEVARGALGGERFDLALRTFLDRFRADPLESRLKEEPGPLAGRLPAGDILDAYLGATAEALSAEFRLPVPAWAGSPDRCLRRPWFALPWVGLRAVLLLESPAPFRSRNLFVSANALSRA